VANLARGTIDSSPLDLFYYPNDPSLSNIDNCTPHLDPGFLAIAICSRDPGFRVWDVALRQWICGAANPEVWKRMPRSTHTHIAPPTPPSDMHRHSRTNITANHLPGGGGGLECVCVCVCVCVCACACAYVLRVHANTGAHVMRRCDTV